MAPDTAYVRPIDLFHTTAFRLAMRYAGFYSLLVVASLLVIYAGASAQLAGQVDAGLRAERDALRALYAARGLDAVRKVVAERSTVEAMAASDRGDTGPRQYLLTAPDGKRLAGSLEQWPASLSASATNPATLTIPITHQQPGIDIPAGTYDLRAVSTTLPGGYRLLIGQALNELEEFRTAVLALVIGAIVITLGAGLTGGALMGRSVVNQLRSITKTTDRIMAGDLAQRIPANDRDDEFGALSQQLNEMLGRIEALLTAMREVSANVAHDLRRPLTRLRNRLEASLMGERNPAEYRETLDAAIADVDGLVRTLHAMLAIAQIEAGVDGRAAWEEFDAAAVCQDALDLYEPLADSRNLAVTSDLTPQLTVTGNRQLVLQAVSNLLDNAVTYTPAGGSVGIHAARRESTIVITVTDTGPGIPRAERMRVLERVVRLENSPSTPGNGLGLALVNAVAHHHCGDVRLADNGPGLRISLVFPATGGEPT